MNLIHLGDGRILRATAEDSKVYKRLKELAELISEDSGVAWNWPQVATLTRPSLSRILHLARMYEMISDIPGSICEFGAHFGSSSAVLTNLRTLMEPFNYNRQLLVFDTFEGFTSVTEIDRASQIGTFGLPHDYKDLLEELLSLHEKLAPQPHVQKHTVIAGDASVTVPHYLDNHPETIIAMAIFDMDLYLPTRDALAAIIPRLTCGSLLVFDELNFEGYPGETVALREVVGLDRLELQRHPSMPHTAWCRWRA